MKWYNTANEDNLSAISFIEKNDVFLSISKRCKISDFLGINEFILTPIF